MGCTLPHPSSIKIMPPQTCQQSRSMEAFPWFNISSSQMTLSCFMLTSKSPAHCGKVSSTLSWSNAYECSTVGTIGCDKQKEGGQSYMQCVHPSPNSQTHWALRISILLSVGVFPHNLNFTPRVTPRSLCTNSDIKLESNFFLKKNLAL